MAGPAAVLRDLHRLRRHARDLQEQIDRGPRALDLQKAKVARQQEILQEAHDTIKRLKVRTHEQEVSLKSKVQQIAKHERQRDEATSKKEYDALQAEIDVEKKACQKLEDEILDAMGQTEDLLARIPQLEKEVEQAKQDSFRAIEEIQARRHRAVEGLAEVHKQLHELEASLPADVRIQYDRLVTARGDDALATVQGRTCAACYTEITAQMYNDLMVGLFVPCKNCGRILYLPE